MNIDPATILLIILAIFLLYLAITYCKNNYEKYTNFNKESYKISHNAYYKHPK